MTNLPKQRPQAISEVMEEAKENYIINLMLNFWQEANLCYEKKINHITDLVWKEEETGWLCGILDESRGKQICELEICSEDEKKLQSLLREIRDCNLQEILDKKKEFEEIGFSIVTVTVAGKRTIGMNKRIFCN